MSSHPTALWLDSIGKRPRLPAAVEKDLLFQVHAWQQGKLDEATGRKAVAKMVEHNLGLVSATARTFFGWVTYKDNRLPDLLQAGVVGMVRGVEKFDPTRGWKFSTYVTHWIRHGMTAHVQGGWRMIRVPGTWAELFSKAKRFSADFEQQHHRPPTQAEIAAGIDLPEHTMAERFAIYSTTQTSSLNAVIDTGTEYLETIAAPPLEDPEVEAARTALQRIFDAASLPAADRELLTRAIERQARDGSRPVSELAEEFGITRKEFTARYIKAIRRCRKTPEVQRSSLAAILSEA